MRISKARFYTLAPGWCAVAIATIAAIACHDNDVVSTVGICHAGDEATCRGASGCVGLQECQGDGTWSECDCSPVGSSLLGGPCSDDGACPEGANCLMPTGSDWLGGGPPVGLCVADCSADVAACNRFANAVCVSAERTEAAGAVRSLCMPKCNLTTGTKEAMACSAVPSSACEPLEKVNAGYCRPFCTFDGDCPSAHCDREVGVCVAEAPPVKPVAFGETCDTAAPGCDGVCLKLTAAAALCSSRCIFGDYGECGIERAEPVAGVCAYAATEAKPGNLGYCTPLCNCNDDCHASAFVCQAFSSADTQKALAHQGMCIPAVDSAGVVHDGVPCSQ